MEMDLEQTESHFLREADLLMNLMLVGKLAREKEAIGFLGGNSS